MEIAFANHIDSNIIEAAYTTSIPTEPITDNAIKCSKSVVPNAFYYISKGENVELFLGTIGSPSTSLITHCWIEHNGEVAQTHVPNPGVKLFKNKSKQLSSDITEARDQIIDFILE